MAFIIDRLRGWLRERGHPAQAIDAVLATDANQLERIEPRLQALATFTALPEASKLAAANKRIGNILRKAPAEFSATPLAPALLAAPAERSLYAELVALEPELDTHLAQAHYTAALTQLARLQAPVDTFFEEVMVHVDDPHVRANRLALLHALHRLMNRVADLSCLVT
jgi:glycyl-tRNA synthetase beta chain